MLESGLGQQRIIEEALVLLNEKGLEGVNLRSLAQRLGIRAPSLYHHFASKSELLAATVERIFDAGLDSVPPHRHWQDWMRAFGQAMWKAQRETRDFWRLIGTTNLGEAQLERTFGRIRRALSGVDMDVEEAMRIQSSIQAMVLGWAVFAHTPYADKLGKTLDYEALVMENLELLIAGELLKLESGRQLRAVGGRD